jgi:hypothetical protein
MHGSLAKLTCSTTFLVVLAGQLWALLMYCSNNDTHFVTLLVVLYITKTLEYGIPIGTFWRPMFLIYHLSYPTPQCLQKRSTFRPFELLCMLKRSTKHDTKLLSPTGACTVSPRCMYDQVQSSLVHIYEGAF